MDLTSPRKLTIRTVAAETRQPIEGVSIEYRGRFDGKNQKGTVTTGKDGMATIEYPASAHADYFDLTARKPNLVPIRLYWEGKLQPVDLPATEELRFEPGTTIGGIVNDAAGHPIAGAAVTISFPPTERSDWDLLGRGAQDRRPGPMAAGCRAARARRCQGDHQPPAV